MEPVKKGTRVRSKHSGINSHKFDFESAYVLPENIGDVLVRDIKGVADAVRTNRYNVVVSIGGLFNPDEVVLQIEEYLKKRDPDFFRQEAQEEPIRVQAKPVMVGSRNVEFETAFMLPENIHEQIMGNIAGVSYCRRVGTYSITATVGGLFELLKVRIAIGDYLIKLDPTKQNGEPVKMTFDFSGIRGHRPNWFVFDDVLPEYEASLRRFNKKLANEYVATLFSPENYRHLFLDENLIRENLRADWLKKNPLSPVPSHLYGGGPLFKFDPKAPWHSRYVLGVDPIDVNLDLAIPASSSVHILRRNFGPAGSWPWLEMIRPNRTDSYSPPDSFRKEFAKLWREQVAGIKPVVPAVDWKELCVVNGFIIQTAEAYPHKFRVILAPDTDFLAPTSRRYYLGMLAHVINGDRLMPARIQQALVGLVDYCVTIHLKPDTTSQNLEMIGYLIGKINQVASPYNFSGPAKATVGGDDTLMSISLAMSASNRGKVNLWGFDKTTLPGTRQYTEQQMKDAPDLQKVAFAENFDKLGELTNAGKHDEAEELHKTMQAGLPGAGSGFTAYSPNTQYSGGQPAGTFTEPLIGCDAGGVFPKNSTTYHEGETVVDARQGNEEKKAPRKVTSIATRKLGRVIIGVSEEHRLVVLVDKHKIPDSIKRNLLDVLSSTKVNKPDFALLEGETVAHTHMLAMRLMELYRKAPGIYGSSPYWTAKEPWEQATNPDLKEALSNHILERAGTVRYEAIYQFNGPTPEPTPLPARRYVSVEVTNTTEPRSVEPTFDLTLEVKAGPAWPFSTVERALSIGDPTAINTLSAEGAVCKGHIVGAAIDKKSSSEVIGIKLTILAESVLCGPKSAATLAVAQLKKFGPKSDKQDCYFLEADKL